MRNRSPVAATKKPPWWQPALTASTLLIASGWLSGAWYEWTIQADKGMAIIFLFSALSTIFPGAPFQEMWDDLQKSFKSK